MTDFSTIDWFRTMAFVRLCFGLHPNSYFDKVMEDQWSIIITRASDNWFDPMTKIDILDDGLALLFLLKYARQVQHRIENGSN